MGGNLRLRYCKTGKARYISHLDLIATMTRALLRAGVRLKYSEGFNPHPYLSVALPLPVGCGSICELMDFSAADGLLPDGIPQLLNKELPEGIEAASAYIPERKFNQLAWIGLGGTLYYDSGDPADIAEKLAERFAAKSIVISKKTKSGASEVDIAGYIKDMAFSVAGTLQSGAEAGAGAVSFSGIVSAREPSISHDNILGALCGDYQGLAPDFALFARTETYDENLEVFR